MTQVESSLQSRSYLTIGELTYKTVRCHDLPKEIILLTSIMEYKILAQ